MHPYIIGGKNQDLRQKVTIELVILSIIVSFIMNALLDIIKNSFPLVFDNVNKFLQNWPFLGYSIGSYITMFAVFKLFDWLFNKYLWKIPIINRNLGVPDFSGKWKGSLHSSYDPDRTFSVQLEIVQTWKEISIISRFEKSNSGSDYAIINPDSNFGKMLKYSYLNKSSDESVSQTEHSGLNELYLEEANSTNRNKMLKGTYFNNRGASGNKGNMILRKIE